MKLQGAAQVGALAAVGMMPCGGQRGQFPNSVDVVRPAVPQLIAGVVQAQHGIRPPPQLGELGAKGLPVQANPVGRGRTARRGGTQSIGDGLSEFFEPGGEVQAAAKPGLVKPLVDLRNLAAQSSYLNGQSGQALPESLRGRFSLRTGHRPPRQRRR